MTKKKKPNSKPELPELVEVVRGIEQTGGIRYEPGTILDQDDLAIFPVDVIKTWFRYCDDITLHSIDSIDVKDDVWIISSYEISSIKIESKNHLDQFIEVLDNIICV